MKAEQFWLAESDNEYVRRFAFDSEDKALDSAMRRSSMYCGATCFIEKKAYDKAIKAMKKYVLKYSNGISDEFEFMKQTLIDLGELD